MVTFPRRTIDMVARMCCSLKSRDRKRLWIRHTAHSNMNYSHRPAYLRKDCSPSSETGTLDFSIRSLI